jgi:hypothetical protein
METDEIVKTYMRPKRVLSESCLNETYSQITTTETAIHGEKRGFTFNEKLTINELLSANGNVGHGVRNGEFILSMCRKSPYGKKGEIAHDKESKKERDFSVFHNNMRNRKVSVKLTSPSSVSTSPYPNGDLMRRIKTETVSVGHKTSQHSGVYVMTERVRKGDNVIIQKGKIVRYVSSPASYFDSKRETAIQRPIKKTWYNMVRQ